MKKSFLSKLLYFKINRYVFITAIFLSLIFLGCVFSFNYKDLYQVYEIYKIRPSDDSNLVAPYEKIKIKYNLPISEERAEKSFEINPKIDGKITWEEKFPFQYARVFTFKPDTYFNENQNYVIKIGDIESFFGTKINNRTYSFTTVKPFKISNISPKNNEKEINVNTEIKATVDGVGDYFNFSFQLEPPTQLETTKEIISSYQTIYKLKPKTKLGQGIEYTLKAKQIYEPNKKVVNTEEYHFTTQPPVELNSTLPENNDENVNVNRKIIISFNKPVNREQAEKNIQFTPEIKREFNWKNNDLIFKPKDLLEKNTQYNIKIIGDIKSTQDDSFLEGDRNITFKTKDSDLYPKEPTWQPRYSEGKYIHVSLENQTLYAYENGELIDSFLISSGTAGFPSPTGDFKVFSKALSARMTGFYGPGNPNNYDLPGVPYVLAFNGPYTIHGTYWHNNFGHPMSHGCINMYTPDSKWLYEWAPLNTPVVVE